MFSLAVFEPRHPRAIGHQSYRVDCIDLLEVIFLEDDTLGLECVDRGTEVADSRVAEAVPV
jgi:hypothetical protein